MDCIIDLYGMKDSTMSNYKYAMPSISVSFLYICTMPFFNSKIFYFLVSLLFYACIKLVDSLCGVFIKP